MMMYVVAPSVLGQPFLRFYLMAEHKYTPMHVSSHTCDGVMSHMRISQVTHIKESCQPVSCFYLMA